MADDNYMHTAEIMKAALPYVDVQTKTTMEFMYKLFDLMGSIKNLTKPNNMAACGFQKPKINIEGLLNAIKPLCTSKERDLVDRILNIFNMKKMYETYNNYMSVLKTMPGFEGSPFGSSDINNESSPFNFNGFDFSTLFNGMSNNGVDLSNLMGTLNNFTNNSPPPPQTDEFSNLTASTVSDRVPNESTDIPAENITEQNNINSTDVESPNTTVQNNINSTDEEPPNTTEQNNINSTSEEPPNTNDSESSYHKILNMLESMIPPEQKETYENMSMLFQNKSYDDNNKSVL